MLLAFLGVSESIIQAVGQWSLEAWKIYIWENLAIRIEQQLAAVQLSLFIAHHFSSFSHLHHPHAHHLQLF
jgi:hypothetical protein